MEWLPPKQSEVTWFGRQSAQLTPHLWSTTGVSYLTFVMALVSEMGKLRLRKGTRHRGRSRVLPTLGCGLQPLQKQQDNRRVSRRSPQPGQGGPRRRGLPALTRSVQDRRSCSGPVSLKCLQNLKYSHLTKVFPLKKKRKFRLIEVGSTHKVFLL